MFRFEADLKVFLHREPIDFRAGINSLVTLVEQSMKLDPFARAAQPHSLRDTCQFKRGCNDTGNSDCDCDDEGNRFGIVGVRGV
ncbi:IS66 family insertion sequence element accessory protein TnpB [Burkholderia ambifaria]|uniref:IS66 family insertion sequence element accessory protein TnpB n=1 Tax=Burkholderia ambifaria TaxID=152480 RepID=UPI001F4A00F0|nr:IS66 family insertion sequence element accessory protein TnpB [Burkholderia ambifaria]